MNSKIVIGAIFVVLVGSGIAYRVLHQSEAPPAAEEPTPLPAAEPAPTPEQPPAPVIKHAVAASSTPLPALADSDMSVQEILMRVLGNEPFKRWIRPEQYVRRFVATIDSMGGAHMSVDQRFVRPVAGEFKVDGNDSYLMLGAENASRYDAMVEVFTKLDAKALMSEYTHYYPLVQQAYQDLGYPNGYFNDRLIEVIDQLLATPQVKAPVQLVRPSVMYKFADPKLEALSSGQKMLIRMGRANQDKVTAQLRELRELLAAGKVS
ncbi:MAG: DUF3014 domain-containing protein [Steroidobacteraceae bacterium]